MPKIPITDIEDVIFNPTRYLGRPSDVLVLKELTDEQKVALLLNWERDIQLESVAEEENMEDKFPEKAQKQDMLDDIKGALGKLGIVRDITHTSAGKFGGL